MMRAVLIGGAGTVLLLCGAAQAQDARWPQGFPPIPPAQGVVDPATLSDPQLQRGHDIFRRECAVCHGAGRGMPGTSSLALKYGDTLPALLEERTDLTPELTEFFVRNGVGAMAQYRKTEISDLELADLAAYLAREQ